MKFIVTEIGKGKYGALGDLTSEGARTPFIINNLFQVGGSGGETVIIGGDIPKIIIFNAGYDSGFTYNVYAKWQFGQTFEVTKTITLTPADELYDRIDVIAVNNVGDIVLITGTPAFNPNKPDIDPNTQLEGTFIYIAAGSSSPDKVVSVMLFDENVSPEWIFPLTITGNTIAITPNDSYSGAVAVEGTDVDTFHAIEFNAGEMVDFTDVTQLNYRFKNKKVLGDTIYTHLVIVNGLDANNNPITVTLPDARQFGFTNTNITNYQNVSIPIDPGMGIVKANRIRFVFQIAAVNQWGFFLDRIQTVTNTGGTVFEETDPTVSAYTKTLISALTLLTEIKTVDGIGSGLDADLLDGRDGEYYDHTIPGYLTNVDLIGYVQSVTGFYVDNTDPQNPVVNIPELNIENWDIAYSWGDHSQVGYLTEYTETDPIFVASPAYNITNQDISNWDEAHGWGDHSTFGYLTEVDAGVMSVSGYYVDNTDPSNPIITVPELNISNWDTAYSWGNHSTFGYLTSYDETDPIFVASPAYGITLQDIINWNEAHSWGDHNTMGYLTEYTETGVQTVTGDLVDNTDPQNPIINNPIIPEAPIQTVTGDLVDNTDPSNPVINSPEIPTLPENWVETVTGKWVDNTDPKNPIVWNNNYVRRLKIPFASLISFDEAGVLHYINFQMPELQDGPFTIEEDEIFVIEIEGIPTDGEEPTDPTDPEEPPTVNLVLQSPANNSNYWVDDDIIITSLFTGNVSPTKIEHYIVQLSNNTEYLVATQTTNFTTAFTSTYTNTLSVGDYRVVAKMYLQGVLLSNPQPFANIKILEEVDENPDPSLYDLYIVDPLDNSTFYENELFTITTIYQGTETPSMVEHYVNGILVGSHEFGFDAPQTTMHAIPNSGVYEIRAYLYINGELSVEVMTNIRIINIIPYEPEEPSITYYPITEHRAGSYSSGNSIWLVAPTWTGEKFLKRTTSTGTIREIDQQLAYVPPSAYLSGDINSVSIPYEHITELRTRYQQVRGLLFNFNQMPLLQVLWLRGNDILLGNMDLSACRDIRALDISRNSITSLTLPTANSSQNIFEYAYVGNYNSDGSGQAPRQVINTIMEYAYYSTYTGVQDALRKYLNTAPNVGTINYKGLNFHKLLVDKGWRVSHISTEEAVHFTTTGASSKTTPIMSTEFNWTVGITANWLTCSNPSGYISNNVQNINLSVTANTTGATRQTTMTVHKWKTDGSGEFHYRASITITQAG